MVHPGAVREKIAVPMDCSVMRVLVASRVHAGSFHPEGSSPPASRYAVGDVTCERPTCLVNRGVCGGGAGMDLPLA
jgi:hypothetical protein